MNSIEQTARKYRELRFNCIADSLERLLADAESNELSYLQFADQLVEYELAQRNAKRIDLNRRKACFPVLKTLEEFDYRQQTTITKRQINQLLDFNFIDNRTNVIFIGHRVLEKRILLLGSDSKPLMRVTSCYSFQRLD